MLDLLYPCTDIDQDLDVIVFVMDERVKPLLNNLVHLDDLRNHTLGLNIAFRYGVDNLFEISKTVCSTKFSS